MIIIVMHNLARLYLKSAMNTNEVDVISSHHRSMMIFLKGIHFNLVLSSPLLSSPLHSFPSPTIHTLLYFLLESQ